MHVKGDDVDVKHLEASDRGRPNAAGATRDDGDSAHAKIQTRDGLGGICPRRAAITIDAAQPSIAMGAPLADTGRA